MQLLWAILNFSLRFCNAFKTYCKTKVKILIVSRKRYTLHTVSTQKTNLRLILKNACSSNKCAKCARDVHFYYGFIMILDVKPFWGLWATLYQCCILSIRFL